jgi:hypothetical protein
MTIMIPAKTRLDAWVSASEILLKCERALNVILAIESPSSDGPPGKVAKKLIDELYVAEEQFPLNTVAETIFPAWEYQRRGLDAACKVYLEEYDTLRRDDSRRWGTYAERLLRRKNQDGSEVYPLQNLIAKMKSEVNHVNKGAFKSCYEIGIAGNELELPLYRDSTDLGFRRGGPCLSHLSFKMFEEKVHLTAIYRSHDYRHKVPGNLLGLARLQDCVAREVGKPIGTLVVHSTYAYLEGPRGPLESIIAAVKKVIPAEART